MMWLQCYLIIDNVMNRGSFDTGEYEFKNTKINKSI